MVPSPSLRIRLTLPVRPLAQPDAIAAVRAFAGTLSDLHRSVRPTRLLVPAAKTLFPVPKNDAEWRTAFEASWTPAQVTTAYIHPDGTDSDEAKLTPTRRGFDTRLLTHPSLAEGVHYEMVVGSLGLPDCAPDYVEINFVDQSFDRRRVRDVFDVAVEHWRPASANVRFHDLAGEAVRDDDELAIGWLTYVPDLRAAELDWAPFEVRGLADGIVVQTDRRYRIDEPGRADRVQEVGRRLWDAKLLKLPRHGWPARLPYSFDYSSHATGAPPGLVFRVNDLDFGSWDPADRVLLLANDWSRYRSANRNSNFDLVLIQEIQQFVECAKNEGCGLRVLVPSEQAAEIVRAVAGQQGWSHVTAAVRPFPSLSG